MNKHFKLFAFCFALSLLILYLPSISTAELSEEMLKNDLSYYYNLVEKERLDYNDRLYILNRIKAKYKDSNVDTTLLEREITKLKNMGQENITSHPTTEKKVVESEEYVVAKGDILDVVVHPAEELSTEVMVQEDGKVTLSLIGDIDAAGISLENLEKRITKELSQFVTKPSVSLTVKRFGQREVFIMGEVEQPGVYTFKKDLKLMELMTLAGDFTNEADLNNVRIFRQIDDTRTTIRVDVKEIIQARDPSKDMSLKAGDVIDIPKGGTWELFILGQVKNPGSYPYKKNLRLLEFVSLAGGFTENAKMSKVKVYRGVPPNQKVITINLKRILNKGEKKFSETMLEPGDIVLVPRSGLAGWNWLLRNVFPTVTMITSIYALAILL